MTLSIENDGPRIVDEIVARTLWDGSNRMTINDQMPDGYIRFEENESTMWLSTKTAEFMAMGNPFSLDPAGTPLPN